MLEYRRTGRHVYWSKVPRDRSGMCANSQMTPCSVRRGREEAEPRAARYEGNMTGLEETQTPGGEVTCRGSLVRVPIDETRSSPRPLKPD